MLPSSSSRSTTLAKLSLEADDLLPKEALEPELNTAAVDSMYARAYLLGLLEHHLLKAMSSLLDKFFFFFCISPKTTGFKVQFYKNIKEKKVPQIFLLFSFLIL